MIKALWWIRRDLRLADNQTLTTVLSQADQIYPVFILDPHLLESASVGQKRLAFLVEGPASLSAELAAKDSYLTIRYGNMGANWSGCYRKREPIRFMLKKTFCLMPASAIPALPTVYRCGWSLA